MHGQRLAMWFAIALVGVDLVYLSGASNFLAAPQSRILNQVLILGAMVVGAVAMHKGRMSLRSPLLLPGLAWVGATILSATFSQRPAASLEGLALLLLAAPAYLIVRAILADPWLRVRVDWLVIVSTTAFVCGYLVQAFVQWLAWWSVAGPSIPPLRPGDVGLTIGTVNAVSLYLELLAPIAVWLSWRRWRSRTFSVLLAALSLVALVVTGSRGAWSGALVAAAVLAAVVWVDAGKPRPRLTGRSPSVTLAAVVAGLLVVAGLMVVSPLLLNRLLAGDAGRFELWSAAWSMFLTQPITGVGLGAWQGLRAVTPISAGSYAVLATCHDSILQVLAELGIVGLLAAAWLVSAIVAIGRRALANAPDHSEWIAVWVCLASLLAAGIHSLSDSQFYIPAVVILVMMLVARIDLAAVVASDTKPPEDPARSRSSRLAFAGSAAAVLIGAVLLVPIDAAMIRAELGNIALDRGDAASALDDFNVAVGLHDLPVYRLGLALALGSSGDLSGAADSLARQDAAEPFTVVAAQRAFALPVSERDHLLARIEMDGPYDPTATLAASIMRFQTNRGLATADLAAVMTAIPSLIFSTRPDGLFDDELWADARHRAIRTIGTNDAIAATAVAAVAGLDADAIAQRASIPDGPELRAVDLLLTAVTTGQADLDAAGALLRAAPDSPAVLNTILLLAFEVRSQPLIDRVATLYTVLFYSSPPAPMELVTNGRSDADYSDRLPRYPMASSWRLGPKRPYLAGMVTIEPVYRPKP